MVSDDAITGAIGEKLVSIELLSRKINFWEMKERNPVFDIIIEQKNKLKKVQVKTSRGINGCTFTIGSKEKYDYLVLVRMSGRVYGIHSDFWIIPRNEIKNKTGIFVGQ